VINDAFGYYAYLPAVFIYQDLEYDFMYDVMEKHYPSIGKYNPKGGFVVIQNGEAVNKYPPGVAYFQAPFFFMAHLLAEPFGYEADGYSNIYMLFICIGAMFWQYVFFKVLLRIFRYYHLSDTAFAWTVFFMSLGTNLYFYTQMFSAYSHLFSMLSITFFFWGGLKFFSSRNYQADVKYFLLMAAGYSLAVISRNMNVFCILFLPAMGFKLSEFRSYLKFLTTPKAILSLLVSFLILFSMLFFWYLQTGYWIIDSYPGEYFTWTEPKIFRSLFSAHKGWFFYTPIAMFGLIGLYWAPRLLKWNFTLVMALIIYIVSSWYAWDYGTGFSLRAYIDWYLIVAVGLGFLFHNLKRKLLVIVSSLFFIFSALNILWTVQFMRGIISGSSQGIEHFREDFFTLKHILRFKVSNKTVVKKKKYKQHLPPPGYTEMKASDRFSNVFIAYMPMFITNSVEGRVQYGGEINVADRNSAFFICAQLQNEKDSTVYFSMFNTQVYVTPGEWVKVEGGFVFPDSIPPGLKTKIFFWKPNGKSTSRVRNLYVNFYNVKPE
jgi:hypothetical protein